MNEVIFNDRTPALLAGLVVAIGNIWAIGVCCFLVQLWQGIQKSRRRSTRVESIGGWAAAVSSVIAVYVVFTYCLVLTVGRLAAPIWQ
ncbi:MAG TPA: hypothetical protein VEQ17_05875 [Steroidobacteraceae bacterium]|nr:hypothetical protein [Steroidobacteraceae bacterium]